MTYQDMYLAFLEEQSQKGGTEDKVEKIFTEYNNPTPEGFDKWATLTARALCETCGVLFDFGKADPDHEVLCPACTKH